MAGKLIVMKPPRMADQGRVSRLFALSSELIDRQEDLAVCLRRLNEEIQSELRTRATLNAPASKQARNLRAANNIESDFLGSQA